MDLTKMTAEFEKNCKANIKELKELFSAYDVATLGYDMQTQRTNECYEEVLKANEFYANVDCARCNVKAGDRVLSEKTMYLLSDTDFERLLAMTTPVLAEKKITNEEGEYLEDWLKIQGDARRALVDFIISKIIPESCRNNFKRERMNVTHEWKMIDIIRPIAKQAS